MNFVVIDGQLIDVLTVIAVLTSSSALIVCYVIRMFGVTRRSSRMQDFVVQCLIKDYQLRPSTDLLLRHEFLRTLPSEKNVRNQIREHTDRRKRVRHEEETEQELDVPDQEEEEDEGIDVNASGLSRNSNANPNAAAPPSNHLLQRPPSKYACALFSAPLRFFSFLSFSLFTLQCFT